MAGDRSQAGFGVVSTAISAWPHSPGYSGRAHPLLLVHHLGPGQGEVGRGAQQIVEEFGGKVMLALIRPAQDQAFFTGGEQGEGPGRGRQGPGVHAQAEDVGKVQPPHLQEAQDLDPGGLNPRSGQ